MLLYLFLFCFTTVLSQPTKVGIINGTDANIADYPWMVSIHNFVGNFICGGTLISPQWVLTAGHCATSDDERKIGAGSSNIDDNTNSLHDVSEIFLHPNFTFRSDSTPFNDLALLHLATPINGTNIAPIKLPEFDTPLPEGNSITITGWGDTTGHRDLPKQLKGVTVVIPSIESCIEVYKNYLYTVDPEGEFCAGIFGETKGTCRGDSGGPAEVNGTVIGIVSWTFQACTIFKMPGVFVNVSKYRNWIQDITGI